MTTRISAIVSALAILTASVGVTAYGQQLTSPPASSPLSYTTNWIGNSLSGIDLSSSNRLGHIPDNIEGIYVTPDGTVYTNTGWDEGGRATSIFKDGQLISPDASGAGGQAIVVVGSTIYESNDAGISAPIPCSEGGCGVAILDATTLQSTGASLSGDADVSGAGGSPKIYGMAAGNGNLYVAINDKNKVDVFSLTTNSLVTSLSISAPGFIAVDSIGGLWISHKDNTPLPNINGVINDYWDDFGLSTIDHYGSDGTYINTITLPDNGEVSALSIDSSDNLYVGDQNTDQNIKIYNNILTNPTLSGSFGTNGGVYSQSVPGLIAPQAFRFVTGIGTDASGNIYVSDNDYGHGALLSSYTPGGNLNWQVNALDFVSLGAVDPNSETDYYDAYHHFQINYGNQSGNLGTYYSDTFNPFQYPTDIRATAIPNTGQVQYIQGHKFLLVSNQAGSLFQINRFQSGSEIAIPCVAFDYGTFNGDHQDFAVQPSDGEFIWRDVNGDGKMTLDEFQEPPNNSHRDGQDWWMDSNGDVWQVAYNSANEKSVHVRRYLFQGFDSYGAPIYDYNHVTTYNQSTDFTALTDIARVIFIPGDSNGGTLYVAGTQPGTGAFSQVVRYDNWDQGNRTPAWTAAIPWNSDPNNTVIPNSFTEVGNYFFVDFNTPHYVLVYSTVDGSYVGELDAGSNVGGPPNIGNDDEWESLTAYLRPNGQYVITKEEDYQGKLLLYVWTPAGTPGQSASAFSSGGRPRNP